MSNWADPTVTPPQYYAAYLYDYIEEEDELDTTAEP